MPVIQSNTFELFYSKLQPTAGNKYYDCTFMINLNYKMICILVQIIVSCTGTRLTACTGTGNRFSVRFFDVKNRYAYRIE